MENKEKRNITISLTVLLFIGYEAVSLYGLYYSFLIYRYSDIEYWIINEQFPNLCIIAIIILLLFERKKNTALYIAILADSICRIWKSMVFVFGGGAGFLFTYMLDMLETIGNIFSLLSQAALVVLVMSVWFGKEKIKKYVSIIWFLPGGLNTIYFICTESCYSYLFGIQSQRQFMVQSMFYILALFALGWRLSHVYIKSDVSAVPASRQEKVPSETVREFAFCPACGKKHMRTALFCPGCGRQLREADSRSVVRQVQEVEQAERQSEGVPLQNMQDVPSGGYSALGFLIPVVGLVLYLVWKEQTPIRAKAIGKSALAGAVVYTVLSIIINLIPVLLIRSYF